MPDGRLAARRWWPAPAAVASGTLLASFAVAAPDVRLGDDQAIVNPLRSNPGGHRGRHRGASLVIGRFGASLGLSSCATGHRTVTSASSCAGSACRSASPCHSSPWAPSCGAPSRRRGLARSGVPRAAHRHRHLRPQVPALRDRPGRQSRGRLWRDDRWHRRQHVASVGLIGSTLSRRGDLVASLVVTGHRGRLLPTAARARAALRQPADVRRAGRPVHRTRRGRPKLAGSLQREVILPNVVQLGQYARAALRRARRGRDTPPGKAGDVPSTAPRATSARLAAHSSEHRCRRAPDRTTRRRAPPRT